MIDFLPTSQPVTPATDAALCLLRRERDDLILTVANLRATLLALRGVAIDARLPEVYRLSRVATLATVGLINGKATETRGWLDRLAAWWMAVRAR